MCVSTTFVSSVHIVDKLPKIKLKYNLRNFPENDINLGFGIFTNFYLRGVSYFLGKYSPRNKIGERQFPGTLVQILG